MGFGSAWAWVPNPTPPFLSEGGDKLSEKKTVSKKVTFTDWLPAGTQATFTHGGEQWVAWPLRKHQAHLTIVDRLLGGLNGLRRDCLAWINADPHDAARVARLLSIIQTAQRFATENAAAKVEVQTS